MLNKFLTYNQKYQLFSKTDEVLLTVSGGKDSVAMVHLFLQAGLQFGIAHCNFKLRGEDSEADEQFVRTLAVQNDIPFYTLAFETKTYASENRISIQMAARDLRYAWFEKIRKENNYHFIATAHHKNDVAETMLINLAKGTGLAGLHGIKPKLGKLIRPLLGLTRLDVESFIEDNNISYREDQSNADIKYVRNKIRHQVIPELEQINPALIETFYQESLQFSELEEIVNQKIEEVKKQCFIVENELVKLNIEKLLKLNPLKTYLYYLIKDFGFNSNDVEDIISGLKEQSGKQYLSSTHQLIKDRDSLIIAPVTSKKEEAYQINNIADFDKLPINIYAKVVTNKNITIDRNAAFAYLDVEKIKFPLILRKWEQGDIFQPLGMKGKKKISDFFIDEKLSLLEKGTTWLLLSNNQVCWVVGMRIDDNFKLTNKTKEVIVLRKK